MRFRTTPRSVIRIVYYYHALDIESTSQTTTMADYLERDLNVGFSGGERKRCEAFQLLLQRPVLSMLDEPESGVDLQSVHVLGRERDFWR